MNLGRTWRNIRCYGHLGSVIYEWCSALGNCYVLLLFVVLHYFTGNCYFDYFTFDGVFQWFLCHFSSYDGPLQGPPTAFAQQEVICCHHWCQGTQKVFWPHHCATTTASVPDAFSGLCQQCSGSSTGEFLFWSWASHQFVYICLVFVLVPAFYFQVPLWIPFSYMGAQPLRFVSLQFFWTYPW